MLILETKLTPYKEDPVIEVIEKGKHTEKQGIFKTPNRTLVFICVQCHLEYDTTYLKAYEY